MWKKGAFAICCVGLAGLYCLADEQVTQTTDVERQDKMPVFRAAAVRYQVKDVARSLAFYTKHLDFESEMQSGSAFAKVTNGPLTLYLSGPQSSGSRPLPDGRKQEPGGWNRLVLEVDDLPACIDVLKERGLCFRNEMETGPGGKQIQLEDPDGNPVELFEPASARGRADDSEKK
jgi:glyoxylase I family protein